MVKDPNKGKDLKQQIAQLETKLAELGGDLKRTRQERDALRGMISGEASPEVLDATSHPTSPPQPIRLLTGEEYRIWVHEQVSRKLIAFGSAIGIGGLIAICGLVSYWVDSRLDNRLPELQGKLTTRVETVLPQQVSSELLRLSGATENLRKLAREQGIEVIRTDKSVQEALSTEVTRMVQKAATKQDTIDELTKAITQRGSVQEILEGQITQAYEAAADDEAYQIQAIGMLNVFNAYSSLRKIQMRVLKDPNTRGTDLRREVLIAFRPSKSIEQDKLDKDKEVVSLMLENLEASSETDGDFIKAQRGFLAGLGSSYVQQLCDYVTGPGPEPARRLVTEGLAAMKCNEALSRLLDIATNKDEGMHKLGWHGLAQVPHNAPWYSDDTRQSVLRQAWTIMRADNKFASLSDESDAQRSRPSSARSRRPSTRFDSGFQPRLTDTRGNEDISLEDRVSRQQAARLANRTSTTRRRSPVRDDNENRETGPTMRELLGDAENPTTQDAAKTFIRLLREKDWDFLIAGGDKAIWPGDNGDETLWRERQLLTKLIAERLMLGPIGSSDLLADHLIEQLMQCPTYVKRTGVCWALADAMDHASAKGVRKFVDDVIARLADKEKAGALMSSDAIGLLQRALTRDADLPGDQRYKAVAHLLASAEQIASQNSSVNGVLVKALMGAAAAAAGEDRSDEPSEASNPVHLVRQIRKDLTPSSASCQCAIQMARLLIGVEKDSIERTVDAIERENLFWALHELDKPETSDELRSGAADASMALRKMLPWVYDINDAIPLAADKKRNLNWKKGEERWFDIDVSPEKVHSVSVTGGKAKLAVINADKDRVFDSNDVDDGESRLIAKGGAGHRYIRIRPAETEPNEDQAIEVHAMKLLGMSTSREKAPPIQVAERYADVFDKQESGWVRFKANAGSSYVIETSCDSGVDTVLELHQGTKRLREDDDSGRGNLASRIEWVFIENGEAFVQVSTLDGIGSSARFEFWVTEQPLAKIGAIMDAGESADAGNNIDLTIAKAGFAVRLPEDDRECSLPVTVQPGQIIVVKSSSGAVLSNAAGTPFPSVPEDLTSENDGMQRKTWWVADESKTAVLEIISNDPHVVLVTETPVAEKAVFSHEATDSNTIVVREHPRFHIGWLANGEWYLPIQGERGKRYQLSLLCPLKSDWEAAIFAPGEPLRQVGVWRPKGGQDTSVIWQPATDGVYRLRLKVTRTPGQMLLYTAEVLHALPRPGAPYDGLKVGDRVILGEHKEVNGSRNWRTDMAKFVGQEATITELDGTDDADQYVVKVDVGDESWSWRTANMSLSFMLISDVPNAANPPTPTERDSLSRTGPLPPD
jgi:uncharacterized protein (UPF0147 family)